MLSIILKTNKHLKTFNTMELDDTRTKMYNNYKYCIKNLTHTKNIQFFIEQACSNFKGMLELNQEILELKKHLKSCCSKK